MNEFRNLKEVSEYYFPGLGMKRFKRYDCEIYKTIDSKAYFLRNNEETVVYFPTDIGVNSYYEWQDPPKVKNIKFVLMDLDGTSVKSEELWIYVIEKVIQILLNDNKFRFSEADLPFVSGFSVSEHLQYAINKYCSKMKNATLENARRLYFEIVDDEMSKIERGKGKADAFEPAEYLKEFLMKLKEHNIKIGLVSSGLYKKAYPEILSAFKAMNIDNPLEFYDAVVTAGFNIEKGSTGTLGELEPKPHPWLYAEVMHALGARPENCIGIEDSGAGVLSIRSAGINAIGVAGGNIKFGGEDVFCSYFGDSLADIWEYIESSYIKNTNV